MVTDFGKHDAARGVTRGAVGLGLLAVGTLMVPTGLRGSEAFSGRAVFGPIQGEWIMLVALVHFGVLVSTAIWVLKADRLRALATPRGLGPLIIGVVAASGSIVLVIGSIEAYDNQPDASMWKGPLGLPYVSMPIGAIVSSILVVSIGVLATQRRLAVRTAGHRR